MQLNTSPQHAPTYSLLELFAHGTYSDYKGTLISFSDRVTRSIGPPP